MLGRLFLCPWTLLPRPCKGQKCLATQLELGSWVLLTNPEPESGIQGLPPSPQDVATGLLPSGPPGTEGVRMVGLSWARGLEVGSGLSPAPALFSDLGVGGWAD